MELASGSMMEIAMALEELVNSQVGWDQPHVLLRVVEVEDDDGEPALASDVVGTTLGHPVELLKDHAMGLVTPTTRAVMVIMESWASLGDRGHETPEEAMAAMTVRPSEDPDRVEMRQVLVVDVAGRVGMVQRQRGEEARILPEGESIHGPFLEAMRAVVVPSRPGSARPSFDLLGGVWESRAEGNDP